MPDVTTKEITKMSVFSQTILSLSCIVSTSYVSISIYISMYEEEFLYDIMITVQVKTICHIVTCQILCDTLLCPMSIT